MPGGYGMRPLDPDYDPERDPDYQDALSRFVTANEPSNEEKIRRANADLAASTPSNEQRIREVNAATYGSAAPRPVGGPADVAGIIVRPSAPPPMTAPAAALGAMAQGASMPSRAQQIEAATGNPEALDRLLTPGFQKVGRDTGTVTSQTLTAPPPTPEGEAMFRDIQAAAQPPPGPGLVERATRALTAPGLLQAWRGEPRTDRTPLQRLSDTVDDIRNPLPDVSMPSLPPPPDAPLPAAPPPRPTVQVGRPAHVKVNNAVALQSAAPPVPSGDIPPGTPTGPASSVPPAALARAREVLGPPLAKVDPLELALAASRGNRLVANLTRAGGAAIGRGTGPGYDALDEGADRPLQEMGLREQADAKAKAEAQATGPLSPAEQTVYGRLLSQAGVTMDPSMLAKLPAGRVRALVPDLEKLAQIEATRGEKDAALKQAATQAEENRQNHLDVARISASAAGAGRADRLQDRQDARMETYRQKASTDAKEFSDTADARAGLERMLSQKDPAGVGRVAGRLANMGLASDEAVQNRQHMATLGNMILKARSGSAVTPSEAERAAIETGMGAGATEAQFRAGAAQVLKVMKRAEGNVHAKYPEGAWKEIGDAGGYVPSRGDAASGPVSRATASASDADAIAWARANPDDPRAKRIMELNR